MAQSGGAGSRALVNFVRSRTVAKVDSIGLVVLRWVQCSARGSCSQRHSTIPRTPHETSNELTGFAVGTAPRPGGTASISSLHDDRQAITTSTRRAAKLGSAPSFGLPLRTGPTAAWRHDGPPPAGAPAGRCGVQPGPAARAAARSRPPARMSVGAPSRRRKRPLGPGSEPPGEGPPFAGEKLQGCRSRVVVPAKQVLPANTPGPAGRRTRVTVRASTGPHETRRPLPPRRPPRRRRTRLPLQVARR